MTDFVRSPGSAYEIATDVTAEEAEVFGLVVVEYNYSTLPPLPAYGRYIEVAPEKAEKPDTAPAK